MRLTRGTKGRSEAGAGGADGAPGGREEDEDIAGIFAWVPCAGYPSAGGAFCAPATPHRGALRTRALRVPSRSARM